uniref:hypothetical protein n=1 Tax=Geobacillus sp. (strain Y412MC10) TaxID=481743 RepID=UPI001C92C57C
RKGFLIWGCGLGMIMYLEEESMGIVGGGWERMDGRGRGWFRMGRGVDGGERGNRGEGIIGWGGDWR